MSSKKTTTTNQNFNDTTTPLPPAFAVNDLTNLSNMTENLAGQNPQNFVAPASPLQNAAFSDATNLGAWAPFISQGGQFAQAAGNQGPTFAQTAQAPGTAVTNAFGYTPTSAGSSGYNPSGYNASGYTSSGYNPSGAQSFAYNPSLITNAASIAPTTNAQAGMSGASSLLSGLTQYFNPYNQNVIQSSLADLNQNQAAQRAQEAAQGANANAFGGSRWGLEQATTLDNQDRTRNSVLSNLLNTGFDQATQLSNEDAARRQQAMLQNAQNQTGVSTFNAGQANQRATNIADLVQQALMANQSSANQAEQFNAGQAGQTSQFNAGAANTAGAINSAAANQAGQFNAGAQNTAGQFGAEAANQAGQFGAGASNVASLANAGAANQAGQFGAGAQNQAGQFDASSLNNMASMIFQALNQGAQFNAGQANTANQQRLQAADILGNLGGQTATSGINTADTLANLGGVQRGIAQSQATAPISLAQTIAQLLGQNQFGLLTGQNQTGTAHGVTTEKNSPGLGQILGALIPGLGQIFGAGGGNPMTNMAASFMGQPSSPLSLIGGGGGTDPALASLFG